MDIQPSALSYLGLQRLGRAARGEACKAALREATSLCLMCSSSSATRLRSLTTSSRSSRGTSTIVSIVGAVLSRDGECEAPGTVQMPSRSVISSDLENRLTSWPGASQSSQFSGHKECSVSLDSWRSGYCQSGKLHTVVQSCALWYKAGHVSSPSSQGLAKESFESTPNDACDPSPVEGRPLNIAHSLTGVSSPWMFSGMAGTPKPLNLPPCTWKALTGQLAVNAVSSSSSQRPAFISSLMSCVLFSKALSAITEVTALSLSLNLYSFCASSETDSRLVLRGGRKSWTSPACQVLDR